MKKRIQEKKDAPEIMKELKTVLPKVRQRGGGGGKEEDSLQAKVVLANVEEKDADLKGDLQKVIEDVEKWVEKNDKEVSEEDYCRRKMIID